MAANSKDAVIEQLANGEAELAEKSWELAERVATLEAERDSFKLVMSAALTLTHEQHLEIRRLRDRLHDCITAGRVVTAEARQRQASVDLEKVSA